MSDDLEKIGNKVKSYLDSPSSTGSARIADELASEKEGRKEERFVWSLVCLVMFDVIIIPIIQFHFIWILVFEFIFIFVFGRVCGVDYIYEVTQQAIDTVTKKKAKQDNDNKKNFHEKS